MRIHKFKAAELASDATIQLELANGVGVEIYMQQRPDGSEVLVLSIPHDANDSHMSGAINYGFSIEPGASNLFSVGVHAIGTRA